MSAAKQIRNKIKSIENTKKITKAMQMVATSKMRKTQQKMKQSRPYAEKIRQVVANLATINAYAKNHSPFLRDIKPEAVKKVAIILITSDKGLCGGLNANALRLFYQTYADFNARKIDLEVCTIGHKAFAASKRISANISGSVLALGDMPKMDKIIGPLAHIVTKFSKMQLDAVYVIYSKFITTMKQQAICEQLLPLVPSELLITTAKAQLPWDYTYEPSEEAVIDQLISRYIESVVFQCLADNMASEQAARMVAMKAATENATEVINQLRLVYNKSRQAAITKELAELMSGALSVS